MAEQQSPARRLGTQELGPHAFEEAMPARIARLIATESPRNKTPDVLVALAAMLRRDRTVERAYLCRASLVQVSRLRREGAYFCGYRNIQMLWSETPPTYSIPELQGMIEEAWDAGWNAHARVETGGIQGTRKHIGTSEAQALLQSRKIPCKAVAVSGEKPWVKLLDSVEAYFADGEDFAQDAGPLHQTSKAPVFLQRPRHSLTVVGIRCNKDGSRRLLVFDPAYQPSWALTLGMRGRISLLDRFVLFHYQRDERHLKRYPAFEILYLKSADGAAGSTADRTDLENRNDVHDIDKSA